jgi:hypothetical protein
MALPFKEKSVTESIVTDESVKRAREKVLALAEQQGVKPVERFEDLLGDFWPEDESIDDFIAAVRQWRAEDVPRDLPE